MAYYLVPRGRGTIHAQSHQLYIYIYMYTVVMPLSQTVFDPGCNVDNRRPPIGRHPSQVVIHVCYNYNFDGVLVFINGLNKF